MFPLGLNELRLSFHRLSGKFEPAGETHKIKNEGKIEMHDLAKLALVCYLFVVAVSYFLKFKNFRHLKKYGSQVPEGFEDEVDADLLKKTMAFSIETGQFGIITSVFSNLMIILLIFSGLLNWYNSWILSLNLPFILSGLLFFLLMSLVNDIISLPFDFYATFHIEEKYGFNTQTVGLWIVDQIKSLFLSMILFAILGTGMFGLMQLSPNWWWVFVWAFVFVFILFINYISPYIIEPLFNKYEPIQDESLESRIKALMDKAGIRVNQVFQMDASRRSKYLNAYFGGIGKTKRIVLFDTLLEKMEPGEILSVLAHEAGHWKKKHIFKSLISFAFFSLISFFVAFQVIQSNVYEVFGIEEPSIFVGLVLVSFLGSIVSFPFSPISNYLSRRRERQADEIAVNLIDSAEDFVCALVKLAKDNLSNLYPHPWYAAFYYSHPPVVQRIRYLKKYAKID